jgi:superfamily II DNA or RNA helicase
MTPKIDIISSDVRFMDGQNIPWANKVTHLSYQEEYVHSVAMIASAYAAKGHKVLVVSDRVEFLKTCAKLSGDEAIAITGDIPHEERPKLMKQLWHDKNILYGTQSIFSEGVSLDCLSCLVLGTPVNNEPLLTQLIGRIIRIHEDKSQPVVVDINLVGKTARRQANNRRGYYMKQGYEVNDL